MLAVSHGLPYANHRASDTNTGHSYPGNSHTKPLSSARRESTRPKVTQLYQRQDVVRDLLCCSSLEFVRDHFFVHFFFFFIKCVDYQCVLCTVSVNVVLRQKPL